MNVIISLIILLKFDLIRFVAEKIIIGLTNFENVAFETVFPKNCFSSSRSFEEMTTDSIPGSWLKWMVWTSMGRLLQWSLLDAVVDLSPSNLL